MRHNGVMATPQLAPRSPMGAIVTTWVFGALAALAVGIFAAPDGRFTWLTIAAGASLLVGFAANLWDGRSDGFIVRTAAAVLGALLAMGVISVVIVLTSVSTVLSG